MAEKKVIELEIKDNVSSLKSQLRQATAEVALMAEKFGATSKEAADAAKRAAELKDMIADAKDLTNAFNPDAKFNALSSSIGGVLNGFQAYEGAMGLIGVESKALQETLLKVQSAMALSQGIQGALEARDSFVQLGSVVKNAFAGMTQGAKLFAVTGIGLVISAIAIAASNWDKLKSAVNDQTAAQKVSNEVAKQAYTEIQKEVSAADKLSKELKNENLTREEKIQKVRKFQEAYPGLLKNVNLETQSIAQINDQLIKNIDLLRLQAEAKAIEAVRAEKMQEKINKQLELQSIAQENASRWTIDYGDAAENGFLGFSSAAENAKLATKDLNKIQTEGTKQLDDQIKALDKASDAIDKKINKLQKQGASIESNTTSIKDYSKETVKLANSTDKAKKSLEDMYSVNPLVGDNEAQRKMDAENLKNYLADIDASKATYLDNGLQKLIDTRTAELEIEKSTADEKRRIDEESAAREQAINKARFQMAYDTLNLISNITELFGRRNEKQARIAFGIDKAAKLASATIAGIEGTIEAYKTAQKSPITAVFPAYPIVQAGLAGAFAATNIAKIAQTQFNANGSSVSSTTPSGGQSFTPQFNVVGSSGVNQLAQVQQQPLKAYITSGDVVSAMSLERNKLQKTSI